MIIPAAPRGRVPVEILSVPGRETRLRGEILAAHVAFLRETGGGTALDRLEALHPEVVASSGVRGGSPAPWVPFALLIEADRAIADLAAPGHLESACIAMGRFSARRLFAGSAADPRLIQHHFWTGKLHHAEFADFGTCTYVPLEEQAIRMEYREYPVMSRVFCASAYGFFEGSIAVLGGNEPIIEETSCQCFGDAACAFRMSWEI